MPWLMIYVTIAVGALSVAGAYCAKSLRHDPWRVVAVIAAALLWPVVIVGLLQLGVIQLYSSFLRRHEPAPVETMPTEPAIVADGSLARIS